MFRDRTDNMTHCTKKREGSEVKFHVESTNKHSKLSLS